MEIQAMDGIQNNNKLKYIVKEQVAQVYIKYNVVI